MKNNSFLYCSLLILILSDRVANATVVTWNATGVNNLNHWNDSGNWNPAQTVSDNDIIVFPNASVNKSTVYNSTDINFQEIRFLASGYVIYGATGSPRVSGRLWNVEQNSGGIVVACAFSALFSDATLDVWNANASLNLNNGVQILGGHTISIQGAGYVLMNNLTTVQNSGGGIIKNSSGTLAIVGANTLNGATLTINQGILDVGQTSVTLGYNTLIAAGAMMTGTGMTGTTTNRGTISPAGADTGILTVNGNLICPTNATSLVLIQLGGSGSGQYDSIYRYGAADFRGANLSLVLTNNYSPAIGTLFTICSSIANNSAFLYPFRNLSEGTRFAVGRYIFSITYQGGTDGKNVVVQRLATPSPLLTVTNIPNLTNFNFKLTGFAGGIMRLDSSPDLVTWTFVQNVTLDDSGSATISKTRTGSKLFYRAIPVEP